ncbi:alpha/beta fold hydrolase [Nocardioides sp. KIGAM211]|uniref:Alpha/beta fold hydrolase n=1 Tax=Nocardioides luti TaxID=2761101 RepID=A0A7X0REQ2_9ACTN|nr:alpha/beta fold hydrolase [Nocardioides luti]MBB6626916.1 alpha/beta fold hydrolase [Nocardioides luti]
MRTLRTWTVALALTLLVVLAPVRAQADPVPVPLPTSPFGDPPGANDWSCRPSAERPEPVVLVHGTFGDRKNLLEDLSTALVGDGYCVFSLDYGNRATDRIQRSARELKAFTRRVLEATGAERVSMVGHSQGGLMPRYFIRFLGGARVVDDLVGIAPSNHGTGGDGGGSGSAVSPTGSFCDACAQQEAGSAFLRRLNEGDETPGRVSYTQIVTEHDEVVTPYTSGFLAPGRRTTNLTLQDACPDDWSEHVRIPQSRAVIAWTLDALSRRGPADPTLRPAC